MQMRSTLKLIVLLGLLLNLGITQAETLKDFSGNPQQLTQHTGQGKWTVIMLWASDCHVCNQEAHQYEDFHQRHKDKDASVLGITLDGMGKVDAASAFVARNQVSFPNLIGEPYVVTALYSELTGRPWVGTPTFLIYSPGGELVAQQAGAVPASLIEDFISSQAGATK
jgi:thiol-disulfide isomerase/thioredoxin